MKHNCSCAPLEMSLGTNCFIPSCGHFPFPPDASAVIHARSASKRSKCHREAPKYFFLHNSLSTRRWRRCVREGKPPPNNQKPDDKCAHTTQLVRLGKNHSENLIALSLAYTHTHAAHALSDRCSHRIRASTITYQRFSFNFSGAMCYSIKTIDWGTSSQYVGEHKAGREEQRQPLCLHT